MHPTLWLSALYFAFTVQALHEPLTIPLRRRSLESGKKRADAGNLGDIARAVLQRDARRRERLFGGDYQQNEKRGNWETLGLSSYYGDALYYASVQIGTPKQTVDLLVDTGSTDLYVQSSTCRTCNLSLVQPYFDGSQPAFISSQSSTFQQTPTQVQLSYADGSVVSGNVARDTISIGSFTVPNQTFILATAAQLNLGVAGILGLAFPALARTNADPWWINALDQFTEPEMSFFLTEWTDQTGTELILPGGQFTLGGRNESLYEGEIIFTPILSEQWWTIPIASMLVMPPSGTRSNTTLTFGDSFGGAVIDSGTTLLYGPLEVVTAFYAALPGAILVDSVAPSLGLSGFHALPCNTTARAIVKFTETTELILPATNLLWLSLSAYVPGYCVGAFVATSTLDNFSSKFIGPKPFLKSPFDDDDPISTAPTTTSQPGWLIGDAFLKSVYTVFRKGNGTATDPPSVGFAPIKGVNYAADGNTIIGVAGNGVSGDVGFAGVIIPGNISSSSATTTLGTSSTGGNTLGATPTPTPNSGVKITGPGAWVLVVMSTVWCTWFISY